MAEEALGGVDGRRILEAATAAEEDDVQHWARVEVEKGGERDCGGVLGSGGSLGGQAGRRCGSRDKEDM